MLERAQNIGYIILIEKGTMHVCNILYKWWNINNSSNIILYQWRNGNITSNNVYWEWVPQHPRLWYNIACGLRGQHPLINIILKVK